MSDANANPAGAHPAGGGAQAGGAQPGAQMPPNLKVNLTDAARAGVYSNAVSVNVNSNEVVVDFGYLLPNTTDPEIEVVARINLNHKTAQSFIDVLSGAMKDFEAKQAQQAAAPAAPAAPAAHAPAPPMPAAPAAPAAHAPAPQPAPPMPPLPPNA